VPVYKINNCVLHKVTLITVKTALPDSCLYIATNCTSRPVFISPNDFVIYFNWIGRPLLNGPGRDDFRSQKLKTLRYRDHKKMDFVTSIPPPNNYPNKNDLQLKRVYCIVLYCLFVEFFTPGSRVCRRSGHVNCLTLD
jgi:hypothetical protein